MFSSIRRVVLWVSAPVLAFALVGGFLGRVNAGEETFPHLRVFHDVVTLITDRYVEKTDPDKVMTGAMHGLADSLDPDSAFLSADLVKQIESSAAAAPGDVGIDFAARTVDDFQRMRDIGCTHAGVIPWGMNVDPSDLPKQLDAIRRFGEEVIARMG